LVGAALLEVPCDACVDRLARDLLASLPGVEDERDQPVLRPDRLEQLQPVHPGHVVVAHDTVEPRLVPLEPIQRVLRARLRHHRHAVQLPVEKRRGQIENGRIVVDVENRDFPPFGRFRT